MIKRNESNIVTAILRWLISLETLGKITWVDRCNSGAIKTGRCFIRLHRKGTPDILIFIRNSVIWVECKMEGEGLEEEQIKFRDMCMKAGHHHIVANSTDDVFIYLTQKGLL